MRVGVFTPLLSQLPLAAVLKELKALQINTVELATGNYPGDAHCKLSMLDDATALAGFQKVLSDNGVAISASGSVLVTGSVNGAVNFGSGTQPFSGTSNAFLLKLTP